MTIDLQEERLTLNDVAKLLDVHLATVWRWCLNGVRGQKLESFVIGGRRFVYRAELDDFLAAQNSEDSDKPTKAAPTRKAKRRAEAAAAKLDRLGIGT